MYEGINVQLRVCDNTPRLRQSPETLSATFVIYVSRFTGKVSVKVGVMKLSLSQLVHNHSVNMCVRIKTLTYWKNSE